MAKKLILLLLVAALIAPASGCVSVFEKEYFSATKYEDEEVEIPASTDGAVEVGNYFRLKLEISRMVSDHRDTGTLDFREYDGNIYDDIAAACKEVSANTALGAYCVDYISYDVDRIVAYYEANIYISYKRTVEETSAIITISTSDSLEKHVRNTLSELRTNLVVLVNASMISGEEAAGYVDTVCREDPLLCVNKPDVTVNVYSGNGLQKIYEYQLDYGDRKEALLEKREVLSTAVSELAEEITAEGDAYRALQAASLMISRCVSDEVAGNTAYSALVDGAADSEGIAMAYRAVCTALGIPSRIAAGRLHAEQHYWNMIEVDGHWYHADISRAMEDGLAQTFLLNDSYMWGRYGWDTELYPVCDGRLTYNAIIAAQQNP